MLSRSIPLVLLVPVLVGAVGGSLAGHFLLDQNNEEKIAVAMLALSIALVVPTMVITLAATAYDPSDDDDFFDEQDAEGETEEDTVLELEAMRRRDASERAMVARAGSGLLRLSERGLLLGMPGFAVLPTSTRQESTRYGDTTSSELRFSLFTGIF